MKSAKKIFMLAYLSLGLLIIFYLLLPAPRFPPPDLPQSIKSTEPGDTTQLSNVSAYFTDKSRQNVLNFYSSYSRRSKFLNVPFALPQYRLNHPPEDAKAIWVDTKRSYYLEEIIHPLRESLFVDGFDWANDVFTDPKRRIKNKIVVGGHAWQAKVSLRWFQSSPLARVLIFSSGWIFLFVLLEGLAKEITMSCSLLRPRKK